MKCSKCGQFCAGKSSSPEMAICDKCSQARIREWGEQRKRKDQLKSLPCSKCGELFVSHKPIAWSVTKQPVCDACKEKRA